MVWRWYSWLESNTTIFDRQNLDKDFKFHINIDINNDIHSKFLNYYQDVFIKV